MCDWTTAVHYRNHSQLFRSVATNAAGDDDKTALRNVATYYEIMALAIERVLRNKEGATLSAVSP